MRREQIYASRALEGKTLRFHTWPMIQRQNTGEHARRVALIYCEIFELPRAELLYYMLIHDAGEQYGGDTPYTAKQDVPGLKAAVNEAENVGLMRLGYEIPALGPWEWSRFKVCDILELWEHASTELHMGNKYARCVVVDCRRLAVEQAEKIGVGIAVVGWIMRQEKSYGSW